MTILLPKKEFWKDTPLDNIQENIKRKQGAYDYEVDNDDCRTVIIRKYIERLIFEKKIDKSFTLVDLFCGDAVIITLLKKSYNFADITGVDINEFKEHEEAIRVGVKIKYRYVQKYIKSRRDKIDIVLMLNTYRNFKDSGMLEREFNKINKWMFKVANHVIVTTVAERHKGKLCVIGPGEASSVMVDLKGNV